MHPARKTKAQDEYRNSFRRWKDFVAPGKLGGFLEHRGDGAVFLLAKLDGVFYRVFVKRPAKAIKNLQFYPDSGRLGGALTGTDHFERFELLSFFLEDADDIGGRASAKGHQ